MPKADQERTRTSAASPPTSRRPARKTPKQKTTADRTNPFAEYHAHMLLLGFVKRATPPGAGFDYWCPAKVDDYEAQWALGTGLGLNCLDFMKKHDDHVQPLLANVVGSMIKRGQWTGIEMGFMGVIAAAVIRRTHANTLSDMAALIDERRSPDAAMIRTCQALASALDRYAECADADQGEAGAAYDRILDAIDAARPQTVAGMVAKAKAAIEHASRQPDIDIVKGERSTPSEGWAWDLLHDLLRFQTAGRA